MHLRSDLLEKKYSEYRQSLPLSECLLCRECETPLKEFRYWYLIKNRFPYDLISTSHDMLVLKSHKREMDFREYAELLEIKDNLHEYNSLIENFPKEMSIQNHHHIHLLKYL